MLSALLPLVLPLVLLPSAHPHHPKALGILAAGGKVEVLYFTVPYDAEEVATLDPGQDWHLAFCRLDTEVPLRCDETLLIPAGSWKLDAHRDGEGEFSSVVLVPYDLYVARRRARGNLDDATVAAAAAAAAEAGMPDHLELPLGSFEAMDTEHLEMSIVQRGFPTVRLRDRTPAGGVEFALRIDFGPLHRELRLTEDFTPPAENDGGKD